MSYSSKKPTNKTSVNPSTYQRQVFEKTTVTSSLPRKKAENPKLVKLATEFKEHKKEIMAELRRLLLETPSVKNFMITGNVDDLKSFETSVKHDKRKWALFLKYADVWDDDLKNLGYLQFRINYALVTS